MQCPDCDKEMERVDDEPDVGIVGHWICTACDLAINDEGEQFGDWER